MRPRVRHRRRVRRGGCRKGRGRERQRRERARRTRVGRRRQGGQVGVGGGVRVRAHLARVDIQPLGAGTARTARARPNPETKSSAAEPRPGGGFGSAATHRPALEAATTRTLHIDSIGVGAGRAGPRRRVCPYSGDLNLEVRGVFGCLGMRRRGCEQAECAEQQREDGEE